MFELTFSSLAVMFPFVCVIYAITGFKTDVQQLAQMLGAAVVPGNSQANMCTFRFDIQLRFNNAPLAPSRVVPCHPAILYTRSGSIQTLHGTDQRALSSSADFTLYGYNSCAQGLSLARDLKMSQYTKLPPIACLVVQCLGTCVGAILQLIRPCLRLRLRSCSPLSALSTPPAVA